MLPSQCYVSRYIIDMHALSLKAFMCIILRPLCAELSFYHLSNEKIIYLLKNF